MINNVAILNVTAGMNSEGGVGSGVPSLGIRMYNNISMDNGIGSPRTSGNYRIDSATYVDSEFDNNLSYLTIPATAYAVGTGTHYEIVYGTGLFKTFEAFRTANPTIMVNGQSADPQFVDFDNNDYRILATSPAVGMASDIAPDYVENDYHGRPPDGSPNSGAYHQLGIEDEFGDIGGSGDSWFMIESTSAPVFE